MESKINCWIKSTQYVTKSLNLFQTTYFAVVVGLQEVVQVIDNVLEESNNEGWGQLSDVSLSLGIIGRNMLREVGTLGV